MVQNSILEKILTLNYFTTNDEIRTQSTYSKKYRG